MYFSLLSRFQGALRGCRWVIIPDEEKSGEFPWFTLQETAIALLTKKGHFTPQNWVQRSQDLNSTITQFKCQGTVAQVALATLPLCLFFHEQKTALYDSLTQAAQLWLREEEELDFLLLWGSAIAFALQTPPNTLDLLPRLIQQVDFFKNCKDILKEIEACSQEEIGLYQVFRRVTPLTSPSERAIALALYCFSYTPENFSLCFERAKHIDQLSQSMNPSLNNNTYQNFVKSGFYAITLLTGAIAGAYNSKHSLAGVGLKNSHSWVNLQAGKFLFDSWSGVYCPDRSDFYWKRGFSCFSDEASAIAPAQTLQPRPTLALISQKLRN